MEYSSHSFLASWWVVNNRFIDLGNLSNVVIHYLLIGEMTSFGYRDEFFMIHKWTTMYGYILYKTYGESWH